MGLCGPGQSYYFVHFIEHFIAEAGVSRVEISSMWTVDLFLAALWQPLGGRVVDRYGCRRCIMGLMGPYALCVVLLGQVGGRGAVLQLGAAFFVVRSLGPGFLYTVLEKNINFWFVKRRGRAATLLVLINNAEMLAVPLTRAMIGWIGWRMSYALLATAILVGLSLFLLFVRDRPQNMGLLPDGEQAQQQQQQQPEGQEKEATGQGELKRPTSHGEGVELRVALKSPILWVLMPANFVCAVNWGGMNLHSAAVFEAYGLTPDQLSSAFAFMSVGGVIGAVLGGALVERVKVEQRHWLVSLSLLFSASVEMWLLLLDAGLTSRSVTVIGYGCGFGLFNGVWGVCCYCLLADFFGMRALGTLQGLWGSFGLLGMGAGPLMITLLLPADQPAGSANSYTLPLRLIFGALVTASVLVGVLGSWLRPTSQHANAMTGPREAEEEAHRLLSGAEDVGKPGETAGSLES
jgi:sugar phosphate permease